MHARVATFEGGEADQVREAIGNIKGQAESGPREGLPIVGGLILHSADGGKVLAISLFDTEEDLQEGDSTLNSMDPPVPGAMGKRSSVEMYEVGMKMDAAG